MTSSLKKKKLFEFKCNECGYIFEDIVDSLTDVKCPECSSKVTTYKKFHTFSGDSTWSVK